MTQYKVVTGPNEVAHQGHRRHVAPACDYTSLHLSSMHAPRRGVAQIRNERGPPGYVTKAQRLGEDQVGPGRGPHAHTTSVQVGAVAIVQGSQGNRQARLLTCS